MNAGDLLLYLKGFELMQALREGQAKFRSVSAGIRGEVRLVERGLRLRSIDHYRDHATAGNRARVNFLPLKPRSSLEYFSDLIFCNSAFGSNPGLVVLFLIAGESDERRCSPANVFSLIQ